MKYSQSPLYTEAKLEIIHCIWSITLRNIHENFEDIQRSWHIFKFDFKFTRMHRFHPPPLSISNQLVLNVKLFLFKSYCRLYFYCYMLPFIFIYSVSKLLLTSSTRSLNSIFIWRPISLIFQRVMWNRKNHFILLYFY